MSEVCVWKYNGDAWETDCDEMHLFMAGGVRDNGYTFCPYCGRETYEEQNNDA